MSHDVHKIRAFEHPGQGRKRAKATPKGRQLDPSAAHEIEHLGVRALEHHVERRMRSTVLL